MSIYDGYALLGAPWRFLSAAMRNKIIDECHTINFYDYTVAVKEGDDWRVCDEVARVGASADAANEAKAFVDAMR